MKFAALLLAAVSVFAQVPAPKAATIDKVQLEAYLRNMELWIPQVSVAIDDPKPSAYLPGFSDLVVHLTYNGQRKDESYFISQDGKHLIKGEAYDTSKSPFQSNIDLLKTDNAPGYGAAGAPVTLVVFGDFECPYCKVEAEVMRKNIVQTYPEKVRVYFKDFPLESMHPWARAASVTGRCIYKQDPQAFWKYHDWIYDKQEMITVENLNSQVMTWAGTAGIDSIQLGRCVDAKATDSEVARNITEGHALGIDATPTLYINGRKMASAMQWESLKQLIDLELEHIKAEEEKCCVVNIPKAGGKTGK